MQRFYFYTTADSLQQAEDKISQGEFTMIDLENESLDNLSAYPDVSRGRIVSEEEFAELERDFTEDPINLIDRIAVERPDLYAGQEEDYFVEMDYEAEDTEQEDNLSGTNYPQTSGEIYNA